MKNGIISVKIENFKKIENLDVELNGNSVFLMGDNEVGKSTFMQAIFSLLGNEDFAPNTISKGKDKGLIQNVIAIDGKKYTVTRRFTEANPKGYFEIEAEDGMKTNKISYLTELVGNISFNPFEFAELSNTADGRKKQVLLIRQLLTKERNEEIDKIDAYYKKKFAERTDLNKEVKILTSQLEDFALNEDDFENYKEEHDVLKLTNQLLSVKSHNEKIATKKIVSEQTKEFIEVNEAVLIEMERKVAAQKEKIENLKLEVIKNAEDLFKLEEETQDHESVEIIEKKIKDVSDHNKKHNQVKDYKLKSDVLEEKKKLQAKLNINLDKCIEKKEQIIEESNLPVKGLTFNDDGIFLNKLLIDEKQISTSQIIELGVKISVAINPKLKILRIPRGESLGTARLKSIQSFVKKNKYQVFIEKVQPSLNKLTIEVFEE
jgi:predicted ATP-dependent endonuclease of OLD family